MTFRSDYCPICENNNWKRLDIYKHRRQCKKCKLIQVRHLLHWCIDDTKTCFNFYEPRTPEDVMKIVRNYDFKGIRDKMINVNNQHFLSNHLL